MNKEFYDIPGAASWKTIEFIDKGMSTDKKYHIVTEEGVHLLLRISELSTHEAKKQEFEIIKKLANTGILMSKPYEIGLCNKGVYMILSWIKGVSLENVLESLGLDQQYELGYEAGEILKKIHETPFELADFSWEERFNRKINRKIQSYNACPLKYESGQLFIDYLNQSRDLLRNRPITFQHGDYHVGNMILSDSGHIGIIDFNRFDYGDPWEEFNRIVWDIKVSPSFAAGRVDGYFNKNVPEIFFRLLALYISSNTLSSLPWAIPFGEEEIMTMREQAKNVLTDFNNFNTVIPKWYSESKTALTLS